MTLSNNRRIRHPGALVVTCFAVLIAAGAMLLSLPVSQAGGAQEVDLSDALFTSASAVTVTGLVVVDTGSVWSLFGEVVILLLIQVGGLGIMTLAGFLGLLFTHRLGIRGRLLAGTEIGLTDLGTLRELIRNLVTFVIVCEMVIAVLLSIRFAQEDGRSIASSMYLGVFHSISAFNNAGFSTLDGGLGRYTEDWFLSLAIAAAFIIGGIGFPVVFEFLGGWRNPGRWSLHTKVTVLTTVVLLSTGTVVLVAVEWNNPKTIGDASIGGKLLASFFQSATARTAGFNTVDIGSLRNPSLLLFLLLMMVGASSASTGGGIKTSTFAVVIRTTVAHLRGDLEPSYFGRHIPRSLERQALALLIAALGAVGVGTFFLTVFEPDLPVIDLLFEVVSAFGTVGVSTGVTEELSNPSRIVIIVLMFIGRVGPITFGTAVLLRAQQKRYSFATEGLIVG